MPYCDWPLIIGVDFDLTLTTMRFAEHDINVPPAEGAVEVLNELHDAGCAIIVWSRRNDEQLKAVYAYLDKWKIPYDKVNEDMEYVIDEWGVSRKAYFDIYLDDLNLQGFPGWHKAREIIIKHPKYRGNKDVAV